MTRLLIAYDGSQSAAAAITAAAELFPGSEAVVAHVASVTAAGGSLAQSAGGQATTGAREGVALAEQAGLKASGVPAVTAGGSAVARLIADLADEHDASLVVVGTNGRSRLHSALTGTGATGIIDYSRRPVLVIPPAAA